MGTLENIPNFTGQMGSLGISISDISERRELKPSWFPWRNYTLFRTDFKIGGQKAWIGEKYNGVHRLEYNGPVPDPDNVGLTRKHVRLIAYEYAEDEWTRADIYRSVEFP